MFELGFFDTIKGYFVDEQRKAIIIYEANTGKYKAAHLTPLQVHFGDSATVKEYKRLGNAKNYLNSLGFHNYISEKDHTEILKLTKRV